MRNGLFFVCALNTSQTWLDDLSDRQINYCDKKIGNMLLESVIAFIFFMLFTKQKSMFHLIFTLYLCFQSLHFPFVLTLSVNIHEETIVFRFIRFGSYASYVNKNDIKNEKLKEIICQNIVIKECDTFNSFTLFFLLCSVKRTNFWSLFILFS